MSENVKSTTEDNNMRIQHTSHKNDEKRVLVTEAFKKASNKLSPLWDVRDYVAVNPFFGFRQEDFLKSINYLKGVSGQEMLPKNKFFLDKYNSKEINDFDLEIATKLFQKKYSKEDFLNIEQENLVKFIEGQSASEYMLSIRSVSDLFDIENNTKTTELIKNQISSWASAYFDEGQAIWKIPNQEARFYVWWKGLVKHDKTINKIQKSLQSLIKNLFNEPEEALLTLAEILIERVPLSNEQLSNYFYRLIYSVAGWASYIQRYEFEAGRTGDKSTLSKLGGLIDILVIRMVYDISLLNHIKNTQALCNKVDTDFADNNLIYKYIWLNASENAYRRVIQEKILANKQAITLEDAVPDVQMAFCIDVRSEVIRRHLEKLSSKIQTIGFAGFFALPISIKGLGHNQADHNCPVLLNSNFEIEEKANRDKSYLLKKKFDFAKGQYFRKLIQSSANSGFSFVETLGLSYIAKFLSYGFGRVKPNLDFSAIGLNREDVKNIEYDTSTLTIEEKTNLAFGALKNMGLTKNFAKFVFFFAHGGESANNPYASALDCGACAGHNGQGNSNLLAKILNDLEVRKELRKLSVDIPENTIFLSGWHNTTNDKLNIHHLCQLNEVQRLELEKYLVIFEEASKNCTKERFKYLPNFSDPKDVEINHELNYKANDWSEVRPEWGLAKNAAFIVASRALTRNVNLEGRSFLHDYDQSTDSDLSKLELIMTAPMIVTNWINMQYYASTINPNLYGTGNKVLNNVVGCIGCIQGNEGDLMGGLSEQSVWYQGDYYHEPIRLQVFIEADTKAIEKIIEKHQLVKDLVSNDWLKLIAINPSNKEFKLYHLNNWIDTKDDLWN
jgi:uncharacterized protein YbcC (UPF0753/DUF2309 family)